MCMFVTPMLHAELDARGADIATSPTDRAYGCREFEVRDRDGHVICFGQDLGD